MAGRGSTVGAWRRTAGSRSGRVGPECGGGRCGGRTGLTAPHRRCVRLPGEVGVERDGMRSPWTFRGAHGGDGHRHGSVHGFPGVATSLSRIRGSPALPDGGRPSRRRAASGHSPAAAVRAPARVGPRGPVTLGCVPPVRPPGGGFRWAGVAAAVRSVRGCTGLGAGVGSGRRRGRRPVLAGRGRPGPMRRRGPRGGRCGAGASRPSPDGLESAFPGVRPTGSRGVMQQSETGYRGRLPRVSRPPGSGRSPALFQPSSCRLSAMRFPAARRCNSRHRGGRRTRMGSRWRSAAGTLGPGGAGIRAASSPHPGVRRRVDRTSAPAEAFPPALPRGARAEGPSGHRVHDPRP